MTAKDTQGLWQIIGYSGNSKSIAHLPQRLGQVFTGQPGLVREPSMHLVEQSGGLARRPQLLHQVQHLMDSPDV